MQRSPRRRIIAFMTALLMMLSLTLHASALDDRYRFDDLKMSVSVSKDYYVITRNTPRDDPVLAELNLGYDETMIALQNSDIYLLAYDREKIFWLSVIVTKTDESKTVNNYSDITAADRKGILQSLRSASTVDTAVEVKHNNNIFFETSGKTVSGDRTLYINQSNTVINGMQIDLVLQKNDEEILPAEAKALTNLANSLEFDSIKRTTGPIFEWWRLLLWVGILAALAFVLSYMYRRRNEANRRRLQERRRQRELAIAEQSGEPLPEGEQVTFDEALGYNDEKEFTERAATDLDNFDIKVEDKNPNNGVAYFEDSGESIDDGTDYFDTFFREPAETRKGLPRFLSAVWTYIKIGCKHAGYFFKNLWQTVFKKKNP